MKSITVFAVFVCFIFCPPLGAEPFPYTLSLSPQFGFLYGQGEEQVYRDKNSDSLTSQLLWDLKPLFYGGIKLEFAQRNPLEGFGGFGALSMKFGIPMGTGVMEDRDWLASNFPGAVTHYSRHEALSKGALILDLAAGPSIPAGPLLVLRPSLGFSYNRFSWTSRNGYTHYSSAKAPLTDSDPKVPVSGTVVSYSQDWFYMPLGLSLLVMPGRRFSGILWFHAGPVLKFLGLDEHHLTFTQYRDEIRGGYFLEPGGEFRFSLGEHFFLRAYGSWRRFSTQPHGESYSMKGGEDWSFLGNTSGGGLQTMDLGLGVEVRL
ncbi:MAG: omptin family outer membrane protease [Treponema sp.]|jgi:outer membrane protease|nr:omptin family outer membrane protease [Treponema sp.]